MLGQAEARSMATAFLGGIRPNPICYEILKKCPPDRHPRLLELGCGEGSNALFFARNGYEVTAIDGQPANVARTRQLAENAALEISLAQADINDYRLAESYDVVFSGEALHGVAPERRHDLFAHYKACTRPGGLHVVTVFVTKPFIGKGPDVEIAAQMWISGELFTYYSDWLIEQCCEETIECASRGVAHRHVVNRVIARRVSSY